jgi:hypothetical protein
MKGKEIEIMEMVKHSRRKKGNTVVKQSKAKRK